MTSPHPTKATINRDDGRVFNLKYNPDTLHGSFETYNRDGSGYAEGGLWVEPDAKGRHELVDYDGIYALPEEVATWLRSLNIRVPQVCVQ